MADDTLEQQGIETSDLQSRGTSSLQASQGKLLYFKIYKRLVDLFDYFYSDTRYGIRNLCLILWLIIDSCDSNI